MQSTVVTWDMVCQATSSDETFRNLIHYLEAGYPTDCRELPVELGPFHRYASSLCVVDGIVLMGQRIVIPPELRNSILNALHGAHQGVSAMRARAMDSVYWPDISLDIARVRNQCGHCHRAAKSNPMQPPSEITHPSYHFQMICSDYLTYNGKDYVVIVDRYSHWPMVYKSEGGAEGLVKQLCETCDLWHSRGTNIGWRATVHGRKNSGLSEHVASPTQTHFCGEPTCKLQSRAGCKNHKAHAHGQCQPIRITRC